MRRGIVVVAVAFAATLIGACGNGPTIKSFLAKADPACKQGNDLVSVITVPSDVAGFTDFGTKLADNTNKTVAQLEALKAPSGKNGEGAKAFIAGLKKGAADARALAAKATSGDFPGVEKGAADIQTDFKDADSKARAYGSTQCGQAQADQAAKAAQAAPGAAKKAFIAKADPIIQKATDEIKAIPAPTIDKSTLDAWFTENTKAVDIAKQISTAASQNDDNKAGSLLDQLDSQSTTVDSKADAYGFKDCGSQGA